MRAHFPLICVALLFSVSGYGQNVGDITTVAGSSTGGFAGDGGLSISAKIYQAYGVGLDKAGNFYIADTGNNRIRKDSSLSVILSCAGRCVRVVHLGVVVEINRCIYSKRLIEISKISRLANVSRLVYEIEALDSACTLGSDRLVTR